MVFLGNSDLPICRQRQQGYRDVIRRAGLREYFIDRLHTDSAVEEDLVALLRQLRQSQADVPVLLGAYPALCQKAVQVLRDRGKGSISKSYLSHLPRSAWAVSSRSRLGLGKRRPGPACSTCPI